MFFFALIFDFLLLLFFFLIQKGVFLTGLPVNNMQQDTCLYGPTFYIMDQLKQAKGFARICWYSGYSLKTVVVIIWSVMWPLSDEHYAMLSQSKCVVPNLVTYLAQSLAQ